MDIQALNDTLFPFVLFFVYFLCYSGFISRKSSTRKAEETFSTQIKEAFAVEPDEPEFPASIVQKIDEIIEQTLADIEEHGQYQEPKLEENSQNNLSRLTIRQLREYIQIHNLQSAVKSQLGKSYSRCTKTELIAVLA